MRRSYACVLGFGCALAVMLALLAPAPAAFALPRLGITAIAPDRRDIAFDDARHVLYISSEDAVLRYDVDSAEFLSPWSIPGSDLGGMDISPDGSTLAVADASSTVGSSSFHLVAIASGVQRTVALVAGPEEGGTYSLAYGSDGGLLISSGGDVDGLVPLRRYDPRTGAVATLRTVRTWATLAASGDRSTIAWAEIDFAHESGPVSRYRVSDGNVVTGDTGVPNLAIAVNSDGSRILVPTFDSVVVFDANLSRVDTLAPFATGAAFIPGTDTALLPVAYTNEVRAYDGHTGALLGLRALGESFEPGLPLYGLGDGRLKTSADGSLVFATVEDGVWIAPLNFADQYEDVPGTPMPVVWETQAWDEGGRMRTVRSVTLQAGTTLHAKLDASDELDMGLELFAPTKNLMSDGVPAVASSKHAGAGIDEEIDYTVPVTATYYVVATRVSGAGTSLLQTAVIGTAQVDADDDIPGVPLVTHADGSLDASGDTWDVYATRVHRHEALQVTVTPDPTLDADILVFTGDAKHVVFYKPTLTVSGGAAGVAESFYHGFSADTTCYVAIKAAGGSGSYSLDSLVAPCPPTTLIALSASSGRKGTPATISGRLMDDNGRSVNGAPVLLESSSDGLLWSRSGEPMTDVSGSFTAPLTVTRSMLVRASYAGMPGTYLATTSEVATAEFIPSVSWIAKPSSVLSPKKKFSVKTGVSVPAHAGVTCTGTFHWEAFGFGSWAEVVSFTATGKLNAKTHLMEFTGTTALPSAGQWRVTFELAADAVHGAAKSSTRTALVGQPTLSVAVNKTKVGVGHAVTVSGRMKDLASGAGIKGQALWIESSETGDEWYWVASVTTGSKGAYHYTAHPRSRQYYHALFYPTTTWLGKTSKASKKVFTLFTLTGTKPGDFTKKSVWLTKGTRKFTIVLHGKGQTISVHSPDHTYNATSNAGPGHTWMRIPVLGSAWAHFAVHGYGRYKLTVWN